jgi:hypothetical protein
MYSEAGKSYTKVPKWVSAAVRIGFTWDRERPEWKRRVGVISMPCDTACSALICLGLLRKDLERETANNTRGHYDRLLRAADIYLSNPSLETVLINSQGKNITKWSFEGKTDVGIKVLAGHKETVKKKGKHVLNPNGPITGYITESNAYQWRLEGDPVVETIGGGGALLQDDYSNITGCSGDIIAENLRRSFSGVLLAGKGEHRDTVYMTNIYEVGFGDEFQRKELGELLTLHTPGNMVKRLNFCNHLNIDKQGKDYYLVIADGTQAFLKALRYFRSSDVLGIFSRDEPAENLINVAENLADLERYYRPIDELGEKAILPKIIEYMILEERDVVESN